ncbi:MAG: AtpZ/AtpI family protein [Candidatus Falkowbacteria bacterium]|nr:AtpZ/AtpI family protein [Candidatus Falkowbacteria bacterium]
MSENKDQLKNNKEAWWQQGLFTFININAWIVAPLLIALFVGRWLDSKFNTEPIILIISVALSFTVSMIAIIKQSRKNL